jgi:hypothetical protein
MWLLALPWHQAAAAAAAMLELAHLSAAPLMLPAGAAAAGSASLHCKLSLLLSSAAILLLLTPSTVMGRSHGSLEGEAAAAAAAASCDSYCVGWDCHPIRSNGVTGVAVMTQFQPHERCLFAQTLEQSRAMHWQLLLVGVANGSGLV